jgi:hypothetical protein
MHLRKILSKICAICAKKSPLRYLVIPVSKISVHGAPGHIIVHGDIVPVKFTVTIYRNMK